MGGDIIFRILLRRGSITEFLKKVLDTALVVASNQRIKREMVVNGEM